MANGRTDPLIGYQYGIELSGAVAGYFTECSGIGSESDVTEHKITVNGKEAIQKIPGRLKLENVTLKRGITDSMDMWNWRKQIEDGKVDEARKNGSILMYNQHLEEIARWNFENAWPVKISGPSMKSDSSDIGIEELTITHEGMWRVS